MSSNDKELTGGSGDVNPQIWTVDVTQGTINTPERLLMVVPVVRALGSAPKGKVFAFELIRVKTLIAPGVGLPLSGADQHMEWSIGVGTDVPGLGKDTTFYTSSILLGVGMGMLNQKASDGEFTDGAGHGLIITNPQMNFEISTLSMSAIQTATFRLFYRWKLVDINEIITSTL